MVVDLPDALPPSRQTISGTTSRSDKQALVYSYR
jgi:hypothetical protein